MKSNQLKFGSILSYVQMALNILIGIIYTPMMLRLLGQSEYGLYSTVSSAISMLSVLSLGFNSSYIRFYSSYKAKNDIKSINKLNGLFLFIFIIIGFIALLCGLFLSFNLEMVFDKGLNQSEYHIAQNLMVLLTINLAISFPMSVFQNIISAHEEYIILKTIGMLKTVLAPLITLPLLLAGFRSTAMVLVTVVLSLLSDGVFFLFSRRKLNVQFQFSQFEKGIFKHLFTFTFFIALNMIVDQVNSNLGKFLLGRFKGTEVVAVYAVGFSLYQYYVMFSTAVSGVFTPRIHKIVNATKENMAEQKKELSELFIKVGRIQFLILALILTGFLFFGQSFIVLWAGNSYQSSYYVASTLMFSVSIAMIQNLGIEVQRALNKHQFRSVAYMLMAGINIVLTVKFCQKYGAVGAAIGTAISFIFINGLIMNIYYHKQCNIDIVLFWKNIFRMGRGLVIPVVAGLLMTHFFNAASAMTKLTAIPLYAGIYIISMWFFGMNQYEKGLLAKTIRRIVKNDKNNR